MSRLTHLDSQGTAQMVDVSTKESSVREAVATGRIHLLSDTIDQLYAGELPKGDALAVARIAAIQGAKKTADLIPLCHPLMIDNVHIDFIREEQAVAMKAKVRCTGKTGVEMEALTAVSVGLLALYDMVKAVERTARIDGICLLEKSGGVSGSWSSASG